MIRAYLWVCVVTLALGCQKPTPQGTTSVAPRQAASKLSILVVNDPPLAAGIKLLRGEWAERSGGQLEIAEGTVQQLLDASELTADLILYPSRYVGTLVGHEWLRPVRKSVLESDEVALDDMFPLIRNTILPYGDQVFALSLGEPPLMLAGNVAQEAASQENGSTWEKVDFRLTDRYSTLKYPRAVELLVRGTAYAQHRNRIAGWFDVETMQPTIASPPFVRAFERMIQNEKLTAESQASISWPAALREHSSVLSAEEPIAFALLPNAEQVYNPLRNIWDKNEEGKPIAFLGFAGRSVSVAKSTRNSASAFKLLRWLVSEKIATQLSPRSEATVWFRKSQAVKAKRWLAKRWLAKSGADDATVVAITKLLASSSYFLLPRIPGIDEYLKALEEALPPPKKTSKGLSPEEALREAVEEWNKLTDRYGRDRQRVAYRKHLGLHENDQ